jgi:hypothetical protein
MRFIRYWILATYGDEKLQASQVYDWFRSHGDELGYKRDPLRFAEELFAASRAYVNFAGGKLESGTPCEPLRNTWHMSHAARQHLILMLAARGLGEEAQHRLAAEVEALYFVYIVTRRPKNFFESRFVSWAEELRPMTALDDLEGFLATKIRPERQKLARQFRTEFMALNSADMPKYRVKYVLAKMSQHLNRLAFSAERDRSLSAFLDRSFEVEHIASSSNGIPFEVPEEDDPRVLTNIGNLTLLERPINAAVSNRPFQEKLAGYRNSQVLLTSGLTGEVKFGLDTSADRALAFVHAYAEWNYEAYLHRRERLADLAERVWLVGDVG